MAFYDWLLIVHLLGVLVFLGTHAVHIPVAFRLRRQRDPIRVARLANVSAKTVGVTHLAMITILATGIWMGVEVGWWRFGWWWAAIVLLTLVWVVMGVMGTRHYDKVRGGVGVQQFYPKKGAPPPPKATSEDLHRILSSRRPWLLLLIGVASLALFLWLMGSKPF